MAVKITHGEAAVDQEYFYRDMDSCPVGCRVILLNPGNVATISVYSPKDTYWRGWSPLPKIRKQKP